MPITPAFLQARAAERRQRAITYLPYPPALKLPCRMRFKFWRAIFKANYWHGYVFHEESITLCHYTERQRIELCFAENAFFTGRTPLAGDVFQLLWRLHPDFIRPNGEIPNRRHPGHEPRYAETDAEAGRSRRSRAGIRRLVENLALPDSVRILHAWLKLSDQDIQSSTEPAGITGRLASTRKPESCPWDDFCDFYGSRYGLTRDQVLDYPRAYLHQLYRNSILAQPDSELTVFAPSDSVA